LTAQRVVEERGQREVRYGDKERVRGSEVSTTAGG